MWSAGLIALPVSLLSLLVLVVGFAAATLPPAGLTRALRLGGSHPSAWTIPLHRSQVAGAGNRRRRRTEGDVAVVGPQLGIADLEVSSNRQSYYTTISIGPPNNRSDLIYFRVALDTGSSDLWLYSSACATPACKQVPRYPLWYQSPSFVSVNGNQTAFEVGYADGSMANGFLAQESVSLANLTVVNQTLGLIDNSTVLLDDDISGILGLGFPRLSTFVQLYNKSTPWFATLAQRGALEYPLFGLSLANDTGSLTFGAVDSSVVANTSNIHWNDVVPFAPFNNAGDTGDSASVYLQWAVGLDSILVNNTAKVTPEPTYPDQTSGISISLIDIGTSGIYGPWQDVSRLYSSLSGARLVDDKGIWAVPCDISATMTFVIGGQNYTLQPSDYLLGVSSGDTDLCLSWPMALSPSSDGIDWQFGIPFLRTVYSVFSFGINDKEAPMIGFYPLRNATSAVVQPAAQVSSILSEYSETVGTTLPNFPLSTPTSFLTPTYTFNTSAITPYPSVGAIATSGLATSSYLAILGVGNYNASAIPTISPSPTLQTFVQTGTDGRVLTSTSTFSSLHVTLGVPPGWNGAVARGSGNGHLLAILTLCILIIM